MHKIYIEKKPEYNFTLFFFFFFLLRFTLCLNANGFASPGPAPLLRAAPPARPPPPGRGALSARLSVRSEGLLLPGGGRQAALRAAQAASRRPFPCRWRRNQTRPLLPRRSRHGKRRWRRGRPPSSRSRWRRDPGRGARAGQLLRLWGRGAGRAWRAPPGRGPSGLGRPLPRVTVARASPPASPRPLRESGGSCPVPVPLLPAARLPINPPVAWGHFLVWFPGERCQRTRHLEEQAPYLHLSAR